MAYAPSIRGPSLGSSFAGRSVSCPPVARARPSRCSLAARADLGSYLAEAATAIFRPAPNNNVPWGGTGGGFTGTITHHDAGRLREYYSKLRQARLAVQGCMDPNASNYRADATADDGSCVFIAPSGEKYGSGPDMHKYVSTLLDRVVKGDSTAGLERSLGTEGDIISQDDLDNLRKYESAIKDILEKAEAKK